MVYLQVLFDILKKPTADKARPHELHAMTLPVKFHRTHSMTKRLFFDYLGYLGYLGFPGYLRLP